MTTTTLGKLEQVGLGTIWENEARSFTPWLAQEHNLTLLGDTIGVELELEATEKNVGPFRADILCKDTATDNWVLVENQLARTDHTHLGQLMTYAAGLKAVTIVWIAHPFTEEHRAALDWLNEITNDRFNFFGLEIEAWKIGDSPVAPKFNVVCKPNDWTRTIAERVKTVGAENLTATKQLQLEFWTGFREYVKEHKAIIKPTKAFPHHWMNIALGRTSVHLAAVASMWDSVNETFQSNELRAEVVSNGETAKAFFGLLHKMKDEIEGELDESLTWHNPATKQMCRIYLRRQVNLEDRSQWPEYHGWLAKTLDAFHAAFSQRVKRLNVEDWQVEDTEASGA